eukprot:CAMPEP_0170540320 /NCGR_PEP_ID=MMETSP0211-20121228/330_1 /TAXON_ID=311385 /ORGANISM="Pseudokeronopsis sp., Strain OXSARD2" /LENGTH=184 /DNA_ID=CAMNT_0010842675 /DNA_START=1549 /DNA_END=2103 /DNA_ORIENTATION=+
MVRLSFPPLFNILDDPFVLYLELLVGVLMELLQLFLLTSVYVRPILSSDSHPISGHSHPIIPHLNCLGRRDCGLALPLTELEGSLQIHNVVPGAFCDDSPHILDPGHGLEDWHQLHQLVVFPILVPAQDRNPILRLKHVALRRVIDDDRIRESPPEPADILDEEAIVEGTVFSEEPLRSHPVLV